MFEEEVTWKTRGATAGEGKNKKIARCCSSGASAALLPRVQPVNAAKCLISVASHTPKTRPAQKLTPPCAQSRGGVGTIGGRGGGDGGGGVAGGGSGRARGGCGGGGGGSRDEPLHVSCTVGV